MESFLARFITPYIFWIKLGICALGAAAIFGAGMWLEGTIKDKVISDAKADRYAEIAKDATTALGQYHGDAGRIHDIAAAYQGARDDYNQKFDALAKDLKDAIKNRPLPPGCFPDPPRMRTFDDAIDAANRAAAGLSPSPAVPPAQQAGGGLR